MVFGWIRKPSLQQTAKEIILDEMLREEVRSFVSEDSALLLPLKRKVYPQRRVHHTRFRRFVATQNGHTKVVGEEYEFH